MMRWVDEIANRERPERLVFSKKIKRSDDLIIWSDQLIFVSSHHHSILHAWTIWSRVVSAYLRRFVSSISSSICWLRIESFYDHSVEMIYSSRDDFFHIYWFSRSSRSRRIRKWVCDFHEIRTKWQRSSKTSWSKEKSLVTIEDLDSQKNLDESWNEKSINEIVEEEFLYNEMNFSFKLNKQQLAIHSFVNQKDSTVMSSTSTWFFDYSESFIDWLNCFIFSLHFYSLLSHQSSNQYDIEDVSHHQFNNLEDESDS
jgi:hypothetical protein